MPARSATRSSSRSNPFSPLVDEFIVAIADDDAETASAVEALNDTRITIVRTAWHPVGIGGVELARQTNIALGQCTGTWAIYAQADELIHEDDYDAIRRAMRAHLTRDTGGGPLPLPPLLSLIPLDRR